MRLSPLYRLALFSALAALPAAAQENERFPLSGAHVSDNQQATVKFDRAMNLLKNGNLNEAVKRLLELQDEFGDKLILYGVVGQYVSARQLVVKLSKEMTPDALAAYRAQADSRVDMILKTAAGPRDLRRIVRDYPMATRAPQAFERLAAMLLEEGDVEAAAHALEDLIVLPGAEARAPVAAARLASCFSSLNDRDALLALEGRVAKLLEQPILLRGKAAKVKDAFEAAKKRLRADDEAAPAWAQWPTLGGGPSRDRVASGLRNLPAPTTRFELAEGATRTSERNWGGGMGSPWNARTREFTPVHPAAADGILVVNEGNRTWAVELVGDGNSELWSYPPDPVNPGQIFFEERVLNAVTLDRGRVYVSIVGTCQQEQTQMGWLTVVYPIPFRRLCCLDMQTGRKIWETGGDEAGKDFEKRASYHGAPVVDGDRVYCAATYWQNATDPVEHWVVCLAAATGEILWKTFVASGIQEVNLFNNNTRESIPCSLSVLGHRVFTCTNLGVVACVDRTDGGLLWARRYPRYPVEPVKDPYDIPRQPPSWLNNPILAVTDPRDGREKIFVTPLDSPYLFGISAEDGSLLWRYSCHWDESGRRGSGIRLRYLLGIRDGVLYVSGQEVIALTTGGKIAWPFEPSIRPQKGTPAGRGLVAADGVYVPSTDGLTRFGLKKPEEGKSWWPWKDGERNAGNLVMVDQALVVAANAALTLFYDSDRILAFFESEARRDASSPYLRYRLALAYLRSGDSDKADASLRQALALARNRHDDGSRAIADACRRTLLRTRVAAAEALARRDEPEKAAAELEKAREWADDAAAVVDLLFRLAPAWRQAGQPAKAVAALQEIIEKYADVRVQQEPARSKAQRDIRLLLDASGRGAYAAFEKQAADLLARARATSDSSLFEEVLRRFPNAAAAEDAAFGLGSARMSSSDWVGACEAHVRFLREYPASKLAPQALAELAVAYEKRGMWGLAGGALRRLKRQHGEAEIRIEGGGIKAGRFADARLAQPAYRASDTASEPPALTFPAQRAWTWTPLRTVEAKILTPEGAKAWKGDLVLAVSAGSLGAVDAGTGTERWSADAPRGTRWSGWSGPLLILAGDAGIVAYREGGEVAWKASLEGSVLYAARESEGTLFVAYRNRNGTGSFLAAVDASSGVKSWLVDMQPNHHLREFWLTTDAVAWRSRDEMGLVLSDRSDGSVTTRFPLSASRIQAAGADRLLVLSPAGQIALADSSTGRQIWTHPHTGMRLENTIDARGAYVTLAAFEGESWRLKVLDIETGKLAADTDLQGIWLKQFLADGTNAYFVFKDPSPPNRFIASAYQLSTGKRLWETKLEGGFTSMFPAVNTRDHVLLNCPTFRQDARQWTPVLIALDKKTGTESGRIEGRPAATPTYTVDVAPGRVLLTQDDTVEGWGR
ncbi:MAG: PQQ-binding-like beta-propeller repeat protein [Planctomycetes bacterium]|nr:PQQ-binding-like beta-propeller repeat protein [Planctomycetota bacterium]